jgi:hypothetical protein
MTFQIPQRGKEYLKAAQTLLRAAETMTDRAIAGQLKPLPTTTSGELRKLRTLMRPTHSLDRLLTLKTSGVHDLIAAPQLRMASHELFIPSLPPAELQSSGKYPKLTWNDAGHIIAESFSKLRTPSPTNVWSEYGRSYSICSKI